MGLEFVQMSEVIYYTPEDILKMEKRIEELEQINDQLHEENEKHVDPLLERIEELEAENDELRKRIADLKQVAWVHRK